MTFFSFTTIDTILKFYEFYSLEYTQTIPYFKCTYDQQTCRNNCSPGDKSCDEGCLKNCTATVTKTYPTQSSTPPPKSTSSSSGGTTTQSPNILDSAAALPTPILNGGFVIFLTFLYVFFARTV